MRAALAHLDGHERDLVALKFQGGLSNAEIAQALGALLPLGLVLALALFGSRSLMRRRRESALA